MEKTKRLIKKRMASPEVNTIRYREKLLDGTKKDVGLLTRARNAYENMSEVRQQRQRAMRFVYGDQWGDLITVYINGEKKTMTMREYLSMEGNIPLQTNQLKSQVNTIVGVLIKEQNEPVCNAIDRDEQQYGELLTRGLQANNNKNRINSIYKMCVLDMIIGGIGVLHERYGYRTGNSRRQDSWTTYIDPNYLILETTLRDPRFWDVTMIGCWYRMPFHLLVAQMSDKAGVSYEQLKEIYGYRPELVTPNNGVELTDENSLDNIEFMQPIRPGECCVAEIWTLETKERIELFDPNEGELSYIDPEQTDFLAEVDAINEERRKIGVAAGWSEEEIPYIAKRYFVDQFWYCRMMAPDGTILWEEESPYPDKAHPFSLMVTPFIDGRISGYITDGIDHNLAMNRAMVLQDWIVRNQVKGFTMIPQQLVPDDMTNEEFLQNAIHMGNYLFYDAEKARGLKPEVFHAGAISYDATNYISTLKQLMESSTAVSGSIQGKTPYSGTSAALYAQQTMNSSTPIASLLADVRTFMEDAAIKKAKNLAKFYEPERWEQIVGSIDGIFDNPNLRLNEVGDLEFDVLIKESTETPVYRALANEYLMNFFNVGAISLEELLEYGTFPFADKLLQKRQARQAELEAAQSAQGAPEETMVQNSAGQQIENPVQTAEYGVPVKSTRPLVK